MFVVHLNVYRRRPSPTIANHRRMDRDQYARSKGPDSRAVRLGLRPRRSEMDILRERNV